MKRYGRLILLLIVLTLSVGMLSSAIYILGDITRLDLDEGAPLTSKGLSEAQSLSGGEKEAQVGFEQQAPRGPVLMIRYAPRTSYLRRYAAYDYVNGFWQKPDGLEPMNYNGQYLPPDPTWLNSNQLVEFHVKPLVNLTGHILSALNTEILSFNSSLNYYEEIQSFEAKEAYDETYYVTYKQYPQTEAVLRELEAVGLPEALYVPDLLLRNIKTLAESITENQTSDYGKLLTIRSFLLENYEWNNEFTPAPSTIDPIIWFLFNEKKGVGSHFNSAFIMLARCLDIPVRAVIGYHVNDGMEVQYVMPQQAYMWAEVEFKNQGWLTFDASPRHTKEGEVNITRQQTLTNITGSDPIAIRGKQFNVWGTVQTLDKNNVSDTQVEILLKVNKTDVSETAIIVGAGGVDEGLFNVTCDVTNDILVGDYNLIAHTLETANYLESYSDPPIKIMALTDIKITGPRQVYQNRNITFRGRIIDPSDGSPIQNASLMVDFLDKEEIFITDEDGKVSFVALFDESGKTNLSVSMGNTEYYFGSQSQVEVNVIIPTPNANNIFSLLFTFPYNIGVALTAAIGVGFYAARRNQRIQEELLDEEPRARILPRKEYIGFEDGMPLEYTSYEEGVVKLFNRFYVSMQRIFPDIDEAMTPREFQYLLLDRTSQNTEALLEDLISSYEIAMYSNITISQEDFKRTNATIEILIELVKSGQRD